MRHRRRKPGALLRAFDEAQFGVGRILNLREGLPTGAEAAARAEAWLRLKQVEGAREVLIVTGRGANSVGGVAVVRAQVAARLGRLRRAGVVAGVEEHTAGSYVVRLSPMSTVLTSPARSRPQHDRLAHNREPRALNGLTRETQRLLHDVALHALSALGVRAPMRTIVAEEMEWQATQLTATMPPDADRDRWIRAAAVRVLNEVE